MVLPVPIDYTTKDFDSFRSSMLDYASRTFPEWTQASEGDFGILMVELFAYVADILSYYGDRVANEAFLPTATQRRSVLNISDLLAYTPSGGIASTGTVTFINSTATSQTVPAGTNVATDFVTELDTQIIFETIADVFVPANGGTVVASVIQGETVTDEALGTSTGAIDQFFRLSRGPVLDGTVAVEVGDDTFGWTTWVYQQHLIDAGPTDDAFTLWVDDKEVVYVRFGDNVDGQVPASGMGIRATYRVGGGALGNLSAGRLTTILDPIDGVAVNTDVAGNFLSSAMTGGADPESIDEIRVNAPRSYRTQNRLVTLQDFKDAALGVSAVVKANALATHFTNVSVFILGPSGATNQALLDTTYAYLNQPIRKLAGTTVTVAAGNLVAINVTLSLGVLPQFDRNQVKNSVIQALQDLLALENQEFAGRVGISGVYRAIQSVSGVDYAIVSNLARSDAAQGVVTDIQVRDWEIPTIGTLTISTTVGGF